MKDEIKTKATVTITVNVDHFWLNGIGNECTKEKLIANGRSRENQRE